MSTSPDNEFDLEKLFLPSWAQEPASKKLYENYKGEEPREFRRGDRSQGPRPPRRDRPPGSGPAGRSGPGGGERGPGRPQRGDSRQFGQGRSFGGRGPQGRGDSRGRPDERRELPPPLPEINLSLVPDEKGVDSLARQIRITGRAYPLFDIAHMILQKPERHTVVFSVKKNPQGQPIQPLFLCALDDSLWLSEDEAVSHVLQRHFATFYQAEKTATEPPKGRYTFVAQCGVSGTVLGPPNHHDYQNQLRKLHAERFSRMPFEAFKAKVRIVKDEEVVKKWVEDQSWKTEYICLNMPEPLKLPDMEQVEKHFRETHKDTIIKQVESHTLPGTAARNLRNQLLSRAFRVAWEEQRRFPLQIATVLSQQFASRGLQFFKVNKTLTHVAVARPHYLDLAATPVSEGVRKIVEFLNSHQKSTRRQLVEALAPTPARTIIPVAPPAATSTPAPAQAAPEAPVTEGEATEAPAQPAPAPAAPAEPGPTPEQTALIADLHWLIHQGHVIEFANGIIETAKKPLPKPPKPEKKPAPALGQAADAPGEVKPDQTKAVAESGPAGSPESLAAEAPAAAEAAADPGPGTPVAPSTSSEAAPGAAVESPAPPAAQGGNESAPEQGRPQPE